MSKPPVTPPDSDLTGVNRDRADNVDIAAARGESAEELEDARRQKHGRPPYSDRDGKEEDGA